MTIGENIRLYRKKSGLTQKELGSLSNTSETTIKQYELGKRQPRLEQLIKISDVLNVSVMELSGRSDKDFKRDIVQNSYKIDLLKAFDELNDNGKQRAVSQVQLVASVPEFRKDYTYKTKLFEMDEEE